MKMRVKCTTQTMTGISVSVKLRLRHTEELQHEIATIPPYRSKSITDILIAYEHWIAIGFLARA